MIVRAKAGHGTRGIDVFSAQSEQKMLPVLGPTSWLLARVFTRAARAGEVTFTADDARRLLGVNAATYSRAVERLLKFGVAFVDDDGALVMHDPVPQRAWVQP